MKVEDFAKEYQAKTDDELLRLAAHSEQLTPEASTSLSRELARRGIDAKRPRTIEEEPLTAGPAGSPYTIGPPLPAEEGKPPWRPKVAGRVAFFFGPVAGALVVAISLRRMRDQQAARKVMLLALGLAAGEAAILFFIPPALGRLVGLCAEIAFFLIFPVFMERQFKEWEAIHPNSAPASGWMSIGWGIVGSLMFLVTAVVIFVAIAAVLPTDR